MEIYRIATTGNDIQNNYSQVSTNWQFIGHFYDVANERWENWTCQTDSPAALEALLNTDAEVGTYTSE